MILGQLKMGARQAKNTPLQTYLIFVILVHFHGIYVCKKNTQKCLNLRQSSQICVLYAKKYAGLKKARQIQ